MRLSGGFPKQQVPLQDCLVLRSMVPAAGLGEPSPELCLAGSSHGCESHRPNACVGQAHRRFVVGVHRLTRPGVCESKSYFLLPGVGAAPGAWATPGAWEQQPTILAKTRVEFGLFGLGSLSVVQPRKGAKSEESELDSSLCRFVVSEM